MGKYIFAGMITRARAAASMATATVKTTEITVPVVTVGRKLRKVSSPSLPKTEPYNVHYTRSRRGRRRNLNSTAAANLRNSEGVEDYCCSGEVIVTTDSKSDGCKAAEVEVAAASCCSSNVASYSSETEAVKECTTTSEIVADPEVESEETSSRLGDCCEAARESPAKTVKSMVQIKMPSQSEIDDFFTAAEKDLHQRFSEKYNFDVVKEVPLEGRYEWVQIKP